MEIKGLCKDCLFLKQEYTVQLKRGQYILAIDWMCFLCDIFKSENGYCDMWEPKINNEGT